MGSSLARCELHQRLPDRELVGTCLVPNNLSSTLSDISSSSILGMGSQPLGAHYMVQAPPGRCSPIHRSTGQPHLILCVQPIVNWVGAWLILAWPPATPFGRVLPKVDLATSSVNDVDVMMGGNSSLASCWFGRKLCWRRERKRSLLLIAIVIAPFHELPPQVPAVVVLPDRGSHGGSLIVRFGCPRLAQLLELLSLTVPQELHPPFPSCSSV